MPVTEGGTILATYGAPPEKDPDPRSALLAEIARTEAAVEWLQQEVAALEADALVKGTRFVRTVTDNDGSKVTTAEAGVVRHGLVALYLEERHHLRGLCRDAMRMEIEDDSGVSGLDELAARRAADRRTDSTG